MEIKRQKKTNKYLHEKNNNKVFNYILSTCIIKKKMKIQKKSETNNQIRIPKFDHYKNV